MYLITSFHPAAKEHCQATMGTAKGGNDQRTRPKNVRISGGIWIWKFGPAIVGYYRFYFMNCFEEMIWKNYTNNLVLTIFTFPKTKRVRP